LYGLRQPEKPLIFKADIKNMTRAKNNLIFLIYFISVVLLTSCKSTLGEAPVMLFNGKGTSPNDVKAIKNILSSNNIDFTLVNSAQLNNLDTSQFRKYKLLIMPGGDFIEIGKNLTEGTTTNIRNAVHEGLNYMGICAGGFLAGNSQYNSFNFANDAQFKFYSAEDKGIRKAAVAITNADGTIIEHYWEDGPQFNGWGQVVSKYPDGTSATVQGKYGSGWIVLTGIHAEAPEEWRKEFYFKTSMEDSHKYAARLIKAALEKTELNRF
jgi:glutamine amidotransferase-like uncharacterized protein